MTDPRQDSTQRTREEIVRAARTVFIRDGFGEASLRAIAREAGVTHPTLISHFGDKAGLLHAVLVSLDAEAEYASFVPPAGQSMFEAIARRNREIPGYVQFFASLSGQAASPSHPAHELMRERSVHIMSPEVLGPRLDMHPARDAAAEGRNVIALWDGLQLLEQYVPQRAGVVELIHTYGELLQHAPGTPIPREQRSRVPQTVSLANHLSGGYRTGRQRRTQILADAIHLFAQSGYADTSMGALAERVGVSKATLFHHFGTKEALLQQVVRVRDLRLEVPITGAEGSALAELCAMPDVARHDSADEPGLTELYSVLCAEATTPTHPAHEYFRDRFIRVLDSTTALFRSLQIEGFTRGFTPETHAAWLVALWDGLQYHARYADDPTMVEMGLAHHISSVLGLTDGSNL